MRNLIKRKCIKLYVVGVLLTCFSLSGFAQSQQIHSQNKKQYSNSLNSGSDSWKSSGVLNNQKAIPEGLNSYLNFFNVDKSADAKVRDSIYLSGNTMIPGLQGQLLLFSNTSSQQVADKVMHIMGPGRLFRRIDNSPYANHGRKNRKSSPHLAGKSKVRLEAVVPKSISITDSQIRWEVKPSSGSGKTISRRGKSVDIHLKAGVKYKAKLTIGAYSTAKDFNTQVNRNNRNLVKIDAKVGMVVATSNVQRSSISNTLNWKIASKGKTFSSNSGKVIRAILPTGSYTVSAELDRVNKSQKVSIASGKTTKVTLRLPSAMIKMSAYQGSNRVLDKNMTYELYFHPHGRMKRVFRQNKNSTRDTVPPGRYTAILKARNRELKKTFLANEGSVEDVKFNLD